MYKKAKPQLSSRKLLKPAFCFLVLIFCLAWASLNASIQAEAVSPESNKAAESRKTGTSGDGKEPLASESRSDSTACVRRRLSGFEPIKHWTNQARALKQIAGFHLELSLIPKMANLTREQVEKKIRSRAEQQGLPMLKADQSGVNTATIHIEVSDMKLSFPYVALDYAVKGQLERMENALHFRDYKIRMYVLAPVRSYANEVVTAIIWTRYTHTEVFHRSNLPMEVENEIMTMLDHLVRDYLIVN